MNWSRFWWCRHHQCCRFKLRNLISFTSALPWFPLEQEIYGTEQRRNPSLLPALDLAGSRLGRAKENQGHERAVHRRGRPRLAYRDVSRRRRHRQNRHRRFRHGGLFKSATADSPHRRGRRPLEGRVGEGNPSRHQSALRSRHPQHAHLFRKRARSHPALRHRGGRHR